MAEQLPQVELLSKCMVKPASPSPPEGRRLCLPSTDIWWITIKTTRRLFLYRLPPHVSPDSIVESLKTSLAKVLVDFYPVAARLALNPDTERPEFDCNDSGVEFIQANVDFPFGELEQDEFAYRDWFSKLVPEFKDLTAFASHPDVPLLSVQVTGFQGGGEGFCIGTAFQHVLGDGRAFSHFMESWSQLCRGLPQISAKPLHARSFFLQDPPPPLQRRLRFRWVDADVDGVDGVQLFKFVVSDNDDDDDVEQRDVGSPRFPLYNTDFGWGPPVVVSAKLTNDGCMCFSPPRGGRHGMEVSTLLPEQQMQVFARLFHDLPHD